MTYVLHYAPDNASMIIRLALEHRAIPYKKKLVNRAAREQTTAGFRGLNPNGQIPVLETPQGPLFETGAILLWLADTHGGLGPDPRSKARGDFLKWLFFAANTLHPALRMIFYPEKYIAEDHVTALRRGLQTHLHVQFTTIDQIAADKPSWLGDSAPTVLDFYLCALLRWSAIYPSYDEAQWFDLSQYMALAQICQKVEILPCCNNLMHAEGLGRHPFTRPRYPNPLKGTAR
ncbi:MAG: glutathione S-transferase family protein [Pseudomonadota bacterium]